jgi:hypothetical protein
VGAAETPAAARRAIEAIAKMDCILIEVVSSERRFRRLKLVESSEGSSDVLKLCGWCGW